MPNYADVLAIEIANLKKVYASGHEALKGINLGVTQGDFFALLGPNGAGKSTTIGILCSLVEKTTGSVKIFEHNIDTDFPSAKLTMGVVPQEFNLNVFEKSEDIVTNQAGYYGMSTKQARQRADYLLDTLQLKDKAQTPSRYLSGGMKRRLMIARALVHSPKLLILDEPTAGVDVESRRGMWELFEQINRQGTTIILTTHYLEEVERLCHNVAIIDQGEIVKHTSVKELIAELDYETFVLDLARVHTDGLPALEGVDISQVGPQTLEVVLRKGQSVNPVFQVLSDARIDVVSLRNKTNRLEALFVKIVGRGADQ